MFNIVLVEPEIAGNVGNVARLCAVTNASMHLVHPLGFSVDDKKLKRAGLDYWHLLSIFYYNSFEEVCRVNEKANFYFFTTKATKIYTEARYFKNDFFVFGKETAGLSTEILTKNEKYCRKLPMFNQTRSLNLANTVAVVVYEALRQNDFFVV